jgi:riboflavin kinase / FMN adenylyltransferase
VQIWRGVEEVDADLGRTVATVGNFDGVHLGHRHVIATASEMAADLGGLPVVVVTFDPHPMAVIRPDIAPPALTTLERRAELLSAAGADAMLVLPFSEEIAHWSPERFVSVVLVGALQVAGVVVGENFRFGHRARGDAALLARQDGFETRVAHMVELDGEVVSSTHIRGLVTAGEVERAARFLGAPFQMRGTVVHGDKRGRTLGYPTANLVPEPQLVVPDHGVYACRAEVDGEVHVAAVNVGVRPTFRTGRGLLVEAFLLDFDGDLYGRRLRLDFEARLRGERRFESAEALVEQMDRDVVETRRVVT